MDHGVLERVRRLLLLNTGPGRWHRQDTYGGRFPAKGRRLQDADLWAHLTGKNWIGCRAPNDGLTDRIIIDLDCTSEDEVGVRDKRYWGVRDLFGNSRTPLVWGTPSGRGLRLAYRIPWTPVSDLVLKDETGLIPDVFRAAGLDPGKGRIETYPSLKRCDRQLFGARMPLLDPESLRPIEGADLDDQFSLRKLSFAIDLVDDWHRRPEHDLVEHLGGLPILEVPEDSNYSSGPEPRIDREHGLRPSPGIIQLVEGGLTEPSSRYREEFRLGKYMWLWPQLFADLGLPGAPEREDVAATLAAWLADRANGFSNEWQEDVRARGPAGAQKSWKNRYLLCNLDGLAPVDRMRRAAASALPGIWPTVHLTPDEWDRLHTLTARRVRWRYGLKGAELYRFEVWAATFLRRAKAQMRRGGPSGDPAEMTAQIQARWMQTWPWGARYHQYLSILTAEGFVNQVGEPIWSRDPDVPGVAGVYELASVDWIRRRDLAMDPVAVREKLSATTIHGRPVTVDEGFHALFLIDSGVDFERVFGKRTTQRIEQYCNVLCPASPFAGL